MESVGSTPASGRRRMHEPVQDQRFMTSLSPGSPQRPLRFPARLQKRRRCARWRSTAVGRRGAQLWFGSGSSAAAPRAPSPAARSPPPAAQPAAGARINHRAEVRVCIVRMLNVIRSAGAPCWPPRPRAQAQQCSDLPQSPTGAGGDQGPRRLLSACPLHVAERVGRTAAAGPS